MDWGLAFYITLFPRFFKASDARFYVLSALFLKKALAMMNVCSVLSSSTLFKSFSGGYINIILETFSNTRYAKFACLLEQRQNMVMASRQQLGPAYKMFWV